MYNGTKIIVGLIIFLILITFPIWWNAASGDKANPPEIVLPVGETECVAETDYMRTSHMDLLNHWRDEVVRENDRVHTSHSGKTYNKSLSHTCMNCHENKEEFCDRCHDYSAVTPYCWDCHIEPKEVKYGNR